jgi:RHS repeat-associated protein
LGSVRYVDDGERLLHIDRLDQSGNTIYTHTYHYNEDNKLVSESLIADLGEIVYETPEIQKSPYHEEICEFDANHNLIKHTQDGVVKEYAFNSRNEFILDDCQDPIEYNDNGDLIKKGDTAFTYDDQHQLLKVAAEDSETTYTYEKGIRATKTVDGETEIYLYMGLNEIGIFDQFGRVKQLRIPGMSGHPDILRPIAIETIDAIYAPIHNYKNDITKLINIFTKEVITLNTADPFGRGLSTNSPTPWIFAGKNYDPITNLVYFGNRYYSPDLKQWLTPDPDKQCDDLYQYCFYNPYSYFDANGRWTFNLFQVTFGAGALLTFPLWAPGAALAITSGIIAGYFVYEGVQYANNYYASNQSTSQFNEFDDVYNPYKLDKRKKKKGGVDSNLPTNPDDFLKNPDWEETSRPEAKENGHREFRDKKTGERIRYDEGDLDKPGHRAHDHYHRYNPRNKEDREPYLDANGNPASDGCDESHLYPPEWVWWE